MGELWLHVAPWNGRGKGASFCGVGGKERKHSLVKVKIKILFCQQNKVKY